MDRNPAPQPRNNWNMPTALAVAACLALIGLGAAGGYLVAEQGQTVAARDWVSDIAEYHGVYASQKRHLVEVPAAESAHIKTWLTAQVGTPFDIPDLQSVGLQFQGARLLVAAGKPAGQLMYTDASGRVVALCFVASARPATDGVQTRDTDGFQLRSWDVSGARYVLIAPKDFTDISAIVQAARST
jgi:anti-sigma factor RsiW